VASPGVPTESRTAELHLVYPRTCTTVTGEVTAGPVPVGRRPMRNSRFTPRGGFFRRPGATWSSGGRTCSGGVASDGRPRMRGG